MTWRRAIIYWTVFVGLLGYYIVTEPRGGADAPAVPPRHTFLSVSADDVRALTVEQGNTRMHALRDGARWRVVAPAGTHLPSDLVATLVEQLAALPDVEVVNETGEGAAQFGLDPPAARLTLTLGENRKIVVALGGRNPAQTAVYGRVDGAPRIVLLGLNVLYYEELIIQACAPGAG